MTYDDLAEKLKHHGFRDTKARLQTSWPGRLLSAAFVLACLAAMELEGVVLEEI